MRTQVSYNIPSDLPNCHDLPLFDETSTTTAPDYGCTSQVPDFDDTSSANQLYQYPLNY